MGQNISLLSFWDEKSNTYVFNGDLKFIFGPKFGTKLYTSENIPVDKKIIHWLII